MRIRRIKILLFWVPALLALAGTGCVRMTPAQAAAAQAEAAVKTNRSERLKLDPNKVLTLQMQAIEAQRADSRKSGRQPCGFYRWLDRTHEGLYCRMDNAVRTIDTKWLRSDEPYEYKLSTFRLNSLMRVGGRSREDDFDLKVRFRGDLALPGLQRKLHLVLDTEDIEGLPGKDPMRQESHTRLGLRTMLREFKKSELSLGGGLKWRDSHLVGYGSLEWTWQQNLEEAVLRVTPRGFYYSDEGFGQQTVLTWTRPAGVRKMVQLRTAERSTELTHGFELEQSLRFAWLRSGKGRGWLAQASIFPHLKSDGWFWDDALLNITWRDALYRKWIYYTLTPQVQFPREDDYEPQPSFRIGIEILFGGQTGELL